jgi:prepilin signal peptidase PulO-like enzyme (type II secretory pathway)
MEEKKKSVAMHGITYGAITAVVVIIVSLVLYILDLHLNKSVTWITYLFIVAGVIWGQFEYRNKVLGGYIAYGKAFSAGFMIVLFSGIFLLIYNFIFFQFIAPGAIDEIMEMQRQSTIDSSPQMTEEQVDQAMEIARRFSSPVMISIWGFISQLLIGAVVCLITSLFVKKEDKSATPVT